MEEKFTGELEQSEMKQKETVGQESQEVEMVTIPKDVFVTLQNFFISSKQFELGLYEQLKALKV